MPKRVFAVFCSVETFLSEVKGFNTNWSSQKYDCMAIQAKRANKHTLQGTCTVSQLPLQIN